MQQNTCSYHLVACTLGTKTKQPSQKKANKNVEMKDIFVLYGTNPRQLKKCYFFNIIINKSYEMSDV